MSQLDPVVLGIILVTLGLAVFTGTISLIRLFPKIRSAGRKPPSPILQLDIAKHSDAFLLVQPGGRVGYINQQARDLFHMGKEQPDLELLASQAQPGEEFLSLCAAEGQARFKLDGHTIEGVSYEIPYGSERAMVVSFRRQAEKPAARSQPIDESQGIQPGQISTLLAQTYQAIGSSLSLEETLQAILESAASLIPSDFSEITVWDSGRGQLVPYHLAGALDSGKRLEKGNAGYILDESSYEHLATVRSPLFLSNNNHQGRPLVERESFPFESYLGAPLFIADHLLGTLEMASLKDEAFSQDTLETLSVLAGQASIALHKALLYESGQRRTRELTGLTQLTQAVGDAIDSQDLYARLVNAIAPLIDVEVLGFMGYDENRHVLEGRVPFVGIPPNVIDLFNANVQPGSEAEKIWRAGEMITANEGPEDPRLQTLELHHLALAAGISHAVLAPLTSAGRLHGYMLVADKRDGTPFVKEDIQLVEIIAGQAAVIIASHEKFSYIEQQLKSLQGRLEQTQESALVTQDQLSDLQHRGEEQVSAIEQLNELANRIKVNMDIAEIVNRQDSRDNVLLALGREILKRMNMDVALIAEPTPGGVRLLHSLGNIPPNTSIEALLGQRNPLHACLQEGKVILVSVLDTDPQWNKSPLLNAFDARGIICLPVVTTSGPDSAVLIISCKPLMPFLPEDALLFDLFSRQVAITLQNLNLIAEADRRLGEVNLLLDFSRQLESLEPTNILQTFVNSALHVLPSAQAGFVAMWETREGRLIPCAASGYANNASMLEINFPSEESLPGQVFSQGQAVRLDEVDFARQYPLSTENLIRYRDATNGQLPVSSMVVPLQGGAHANPLGVVVLDNFKIPAVFTEEDQAVIASLAQQTALHLENLSLFKASEQRASQLQSLTDVAATITSNLQPEELVASLLDQLKEILPYETGTIWLREGEQTVVRAATGFTDNDQRLGLTVAVKDSQLLSEMLATGQPISVKDTSTDQRFPSLLEQKPTSWLGLPLIAGGEVLGVIALEKNETDYYTSEHVQIATTFAGQAAVALENARLYQESLKRTDELDKRSQRLAMLHRLSTELSKTLEPGRIYELTSQELRQAIDCSAASAILLDPNGQVILYAESPKVLPVLPFALKDAPLFARMRETLGIFNIEDVAVEDGLKPLRDYLKKHKTRSLLALPMATGEELHGVLLVHSNQPYRFSPEEVELGRTISNQTAIAIQNAQLYAETRSLTSDLEQRVLERTAQLAREHQRTEILLRITTELTNTLDLEHLFNRTLRILNQIVDAEQITVMIHRPGEEKLYHLASLGYTPPPPVRGRVSPFNFNEGLAGWVIKNRQSTLIPDVRDDPRWVPRPETPSEHRSAIGVPMNVGDEALGALLFFHRQINHFSDDQLDLIQAAANQVAVAVNNAELYSLIRDQAEDLGNMLRSQRIETSRSHAILEDVADGVLVTDANGIITLFNVSAERILGLERSYVTGKSLEQFTGLFGGVTQSWTGTIQDWSQDPDVYQNGNIFEEQITLENSHVVSVHLAPVRLGDDFLGTVSIFRDITHQVELDRLKSEFVATVSHELRTPMTSVKGYVELLLMGAAGGLTEQQNRYLGIIKSNTERLAMLVNDLLDISRIESGRVTLWLQPVNMTEVTNQIVTRLLDRSNDENKNMSIQVDLSPDLPIVNGDFERVKQILENLVENAYLYTAENGQILVRLHRTDDEVQVDVIDNGIGIPPELQERVFERFYRGENPYVLVSAGTGLGLSIVRTLVEMHRGRIWVESSGVPGEGSTFSFTLPVYIVQEEEIERMK